MKHIISSGGNNLPRITSKMAWHSFCKYRHEASQLEAGCQEPGNEWVCSADSKE